MPDALERCVEEIMKQGKTEQEAWAICRASMEKAAPDISDVEIKARIAGYLQVASDVPVSQTDMTTTVASDVPGVVYVEATPKDLPLDVIQGMLQSAFDDMYWNEGKDYWIYNVMRDSVIAYNPAEGLVQFSYGVENGKVVLGEGKRVEIEFRPVKGKTLSIKKVGDIYRWMSVSSDTMEDLTGEKFTEKALRDAVGFAQASKAYGELRVSHHPGSRVGACDTMLFYNGKLIESGFFDNTDGAQTVVKNLLEAPEDKYKVSIGFLYNPELFMDKTYTGDVIIFERSITSHPANVRTAFGVTLPGFTEGEVKSLTDKLTMQELEELFGKDEAAKIINSGMGGLKTLQAKLKSEEEKDVEPQGQTAQEVGEDTKSQDTQSAEAPVEEGVKASTEPVATEPSGDVPEVIEFEFGGKTYQARVLDSEGSDPAVVELVQQVKALIEENTNLKKSLADREFVPKVVKFRATRGDATQAEETKVDPKTVARLKSTDFWGAFPGGRSAAITASRLEVSN